MTKQFSSDRPSSFERPPPPTGTRHQGLSRGSSGGRSLARRSVARHAALRFATACSFAALSLALSSPVQAGGSHANVDYPPPAQLKVAKINRGGFGRLFPLGVPLPAGADGVVVPLLEHPSSRIDLVRLGRAMVPNTKDAAPGPGAMPLGYVFLGQFIDHDLTFDTQTSFDETVDPKGVENARTPDLDLDCVYGGGPERSPHLFEATTPYMRVGAVTVESDDERTRRHDLLRVPMGMTALIGDPRNDENLIISQMQAAFVAHHNRMVDRIVEEQLREPAQTIAATLDELVKEAEAIARGPGDDASKAFALGSAAVGTDEATRSAPRIEPPSLKLAEQRALSNYADTVQALTRTPRRASAAEGVTPLELVRALRATRNRLVEETIAEEREAILARDRLEILEEARELTIHHYHRMIEEDFLSRIVSAERVRDIREKGRLFYFPNGFDGADGWPAEPFIPIEFAVAAYRFGHSQVAGRLPLRDGPSGGAAGAVTATLFGPLQARNGDLVPSAFQPTRTARARFAGGRPGSSSKASVALDWARLVPLRASVDAEKALKLDTVLSAPLADLGGAGVVGAGEVNLASRNLNRGRTYRLPSGQDLARLIVHRLIEQRSLGAYGIEEDEYDERDALFERLVLDADDRVRTTLVLSKTPMWFYILQEAAEFGIAETMEGDGVAMLAPLPSKLAPPTEAGDGVAAASNGDATNKAAGAVLGPVGGTLVGEVLLGLIDHYRLTTGGGIDRNVDVSRYADLGPQGVPTRDGAPLPKDERALALTETVLPNGERRYFLANFLRDAGVAEPVENDRVCLAPAHLPSERCGEREDGILDLASQ